MKSLTSVLIVLAIAAMTSALRAAVVDAYIPSITGEDNPPGFAGAMRTTSVTIAPSIYSIDKHTDSASPQIANAIVGGTPLGTTRLLFYNTSPPAGQPAGNLGFTSTLATSQQLFGTTETDTFSSTIPALMYMEIPGITGASSTPGHANVMQIQSLTVTASDFSFVKDVDSASPQIASAIVSGTPFATGTLLVYNSSPAGAQPDQILVFHNLLGTSLQNLSGGDVGRERDTFAYATVTPEPASSFLLASAALALGVRRRRGRFAQTAVGSFSLR